MEELGKCLMRHKMMINEFIALLLIKHKVVYPFTPLLYARPCTHSIYRKIPFSTRLITTVILTYRITLNLISMDALVGAAFESDQGRHLHTFFGVKIWPDCMCKNLVI